MKKYGWLLAVLPVGLILFVGCLYEYFGTENVLFSGDAIIKSSDVSFGEMIVGLRSRWRGAPLLGSSLGDGTSISWMAKGFFSSGIPCCHILCLVRSPSALECSHSSKTVRRPAPFFPDNC